MDFSLMTDALHKPHRLVIFLTSIAAIAGLLFGFDTGVISGVILFVQHSFPMSTVMLEVLVSAVLVGAMIGALISGYLVDRFGRRRLFFLSALLFIFGTAASALAPTLFIIIIGRLFVGLAIGIASYTAPLYISEIAPASHRGALVVLNNVCVTGGQVLAYIVDLCLAHHGAWRWMLGVGIFPGIILASSLILLPESPRWLVQAGLLQRARETLQRIRPKHHVEIELQGIKETMQKEQGTLSDLFAPLLRPVLIVGVGLAVIQQITGINTILYYAPKIFQFAGIHDPHVLMLVTLLMGLVNMLATLVAIRWVDKWGRRRLLLYGLAVMAVSHLLVGASFYYGMHNEILKFLSIGSLILFISSYAISVGCIFWLMISEIYPLNVRGRAMSIAASANWAANFIVAMSFLSLMDKFGPADTFWLYAIASVFSWVFCYYLVPETKQCSLETIEANLRKGLATRDLGQARGSTTKKGKAYG